MAVTKKQPNLVGNTSLKAARAILMISEEKAILLDQEVEMREEASGHFSLIIGPPNELKKRIIEADECLIMQQEELTQENIWKIHQYRGHKPQNCLRKLIKDAA